MENILHFRIFVLYAGFKHLAQTLWFSHNFFGSSHTLLDLPICHWVSIMKNFGTGISSWRKGREYHQTIIFVRIPAIQGFSFNFFCPSSHPLTNCNFLAFIFSLQISIRKKKDLTFFKLHNSSICVSGYMCVQVCVGINSCASFSYLKSPFSCYSWNTDFISFSWMCSIVFLFQKFQSLKLQNRRGP